MSQPNDELQKQIEQLKKEKEKLEAEKAKLDAQKALADAQQALDQTKIAAAKQLADLQNQKALADAQKALADAQKALDQTKTVSAQQLSDLQGQKAIADAQKSLIESQKALEQAKSPSGQQLSDLQNQKALAEAQKALADAQTQSVLAKFIGEVKAGPFSGSVDMKDKAGTEEALLLAAHAVKKCAATVAEAVANQTKDFFIFAAKEFPAFQRLLTFRFRKEMVKQAFAAADVKKPAVAEVATPAVISAGLDAFSKILGFFKTDFTIGGIEAKVDESLLLFSVAGQLADKGKNVRLPLIYEPNAQTSSVTALTNELFELVALRNTAAGEASATQVKIETDEKAVADPANADKKDKLQAAIAKSKQRLDLLNGVIALYDSFASSLTTPDTNGVVPLTTVAQEFAIDAALKQSGVVLLLRLENTGGGFLVKKNLLTGLGAMPLFHSGGATVTYLLLNGPEGKVLAGDVIPLHGGFVRTDRLSAELAK